MLIAQRSTSSIYLRIQPQVRLCRKFTGVTCVMGRKRPEHEVHIGEGNLRRMRRRRSFDPVPASRLLPALATRSGRTFGSPGTSMATKKKHSKAEIASKLARAGDLTKQGKLQSEIAHALGVSVMTLHRWRKAAHASPAINEPGPLDHQKTGGRLSELQLENSRLRRLVTDLLLQKIDLEEALRGNRSVVKRASR
jgi:putative transposase